jgi:hypothetical protein
MQYAECGAEHVPDLPPLHCQGCGASGIEVVSGDALLVDAVELEKGVTIRRCEPQADGGS